MQAQAVVMNPTAGNADSASASAAPKAERVDRETHGGMKSGLLQNPGY